MLYNQNNLNVARFVSKNGAHPETTGVFFKPDRTVATDGFRLLEMSTDTSIVQEKTPQSAMKGFSPFIADGDTLKRIKLPKNNPIFAVSYLDKERADFITEDDKNKNIYGATRIDGTFPNYEQIMPAGNPIAEIIVNGKFLAELLDVMADMTTLKAVTMKLYGEDKAIKLEATNGKQKAMGLCMPIKQ